MLDPVLSRQRRSAGRCQHDWVARETWDRHFCSSDAPYDRASEAAEPSWALTGRLLIRIIGEISDLEVYQAVGARGRAQ